MEDMLFTDLVCKIGNAFNVLLHIGRRDEFIIAYGDTDLYLLEIMDRADATFGTIESESYYLEIEVSVKEDADFDYEFYETDVKNKLENGDIKWTDGIWSAVTSEDFSNQGYV